MGALLGCVAGGLGQIVTELIRYNASLSPLVKTLLGQATMMVILGAGVGGAYGAFAKQDRTLGPSLAQGLLAGLMVAFVYPVVIAILHPAANTSVLIPKEPGARLLWIALAAILMGVMIPCSLGKSKSASCDASHLATSED